jgi:N-acyl-D-amino-acid deacylase
MSITYRILASTIIVAASPALIQAQQATYDLLISGGRIMDGTGNPWFRGDVAIDKGRIAAVGHLSSAKAMRVIDARGLVVAPGFIDLHTHSDFTLLGDGTAQSKVRDGVTLDVLGESTSAAPRDGLPGEDSDGVRADWSTFTEYFAKLNKQGISMNVISHVSAGQVRRVVMGYDDHAASPAQIEQMRQLVARSMEEGAWGLVTRYESGGPDHPEEILEMAKVASSYGGNYTSHIGSEGFQQEKELGFAIRVAKEANIPVHIFHLKIRGKDNWGTVSHYVAQIDAARAQGLDVTANAYPYTAMFHNWSAFFPLWARQGGPAKFAERLKDPAVREKIKNDPDFRTWSNEHGSWEGIEMARSATPQNKKYEGMRVAEIAKVRGDKDPADTCVNLMTEDGGRISGIFHTMSEQDVRTVLRQPWVSIASDGSAINLEAPGVPHPRNYSTNARVLGYYARDQHVLTLEDAVRKMTSLPAQILGLTDRGQVHTGFAADIAIFDPVKVGETNSFEKPKSYPEGIPYVIVNGVLVIDQGRHTGARPGKIVPGPAYKKPSA